MPLALRSQPFHKGRMILFILLGIMAASVIYISELPMLSPKYPGHAHIESIKWILLPHALAASIALIIGPFQLSSYFRKKNLALHRTLGKVYVISVYIAAVFVFVLTFHIWPVRANYVRLTIASSVEASVWLITTTIAWVTARNRQIQVHKVWIARSYCITLSFFFSRFLNPIPAYNNISFDDFAYVLYILTIIALVIPDIMMEWKAIFLSKKKQVG